jgi:hypothetical protein
MEQSKVENYVVYINRDVIKNLVIYSLGLMSLFAVSFSFDSLLFPAIGLTGYLASNLLMILLSGLRLPGYQDALNRYTSDKAAKKAMVSNYLAIKSTKPFALTRNQHLISLALGVACAVGAYLSMGPAM